MNAAEDQSRTIPDALIDRLVDGDLDDVARRDLLLRLEAEPDGWRRCSMAFLEDQAWRRALRAPVPAVVGPIAGPVPRAGRRRWSLRIPVAASALVATFLGGLAIGGRSSGTKPVEVARPTPGPASPGGPIREVGWIDVVDGSEGAAPTGRVPILSGPGLDDRWLRDRPPTVPEYVRAQWERQGYQVEERRKVVSVDLADGRRVSIPVGEVAVEYVGQQPY